MAPHTRKRLILALALSVLSGTGISAEPHSVVAARLQADLEVVKMFRPAYPFWQYIFIIPDGRIAFGSGEDGRLLVTFPSAGDWGRDAEWADRRLAGSLDRATWPKRLDDRRDLVVRLLEPEGGSLVHNPTLRASLVEEGARVAASPQPVPGEAIASVTEKLQTIEKQGLPIGFSCVTTDWTADLDARSLRTMLGECWKATKARSGSAWVLKAIGWLITALAVSLGGPFWFDLLNRLVDMRGAGKKPPAVTTAAAAQP